MAAIWRAARGKRSGWRAWTISSAMCGSMNQAQWTTESKRSSAVTRPGRLKARCRRTFGQLAEPEQPVG